MRSLFLLIICLLTTTLSITTSAQVVKCLDDKGNILYKQPPCPTGYKEVTSKSLKALTYVKKRDDITVGIDMHHGKAWNNLHDTLKKYDFQIKLFDHSITENKLKDLEVLIISNATKPFTSSEVRDISTYVKRGGGLICAGQAWSWVYKEYGNKSIETFPLNQLGQEMDFWITGENIGSPKNLSSEIMKDISNLKRAKWWPSRIELRSQKSTVMVRDEALRIMAGFYPFGKGRIFVYGHTGLLENNPKVTINSVLHLADN